jgi:hypothetical protein
MSAPQKTAAEWADYLTDYVTEHQHCPYVMVSYGDDEQDAKRVPVWLTSVDVHAGTCATMTDTGHVTYLTTTDDLRIYIPPADTEADA